MCPFVGRVLETPGASKVIQSFPTGYAMSRAGQEIREHAKHKPKPNGAVNVKISNLYDPY